MGAGGIAAAQVALEGLARVRVVEHRPVRTGDRAQLAADASIVDDVLGSGRVDGDGADRARRHAPALGTLHASIGRVGGVAFERRHADDGLGRLVLAGLHVRAGQLAAQTAGAALGGDLEDAHRFFRPFLPSRPSRREMNSSSGMAAVVMPATPPRAPSSTDMRVIAALSAGSMMVTKSEGPSTADWAPTRPPLRSA